MRFSKIKLYFIKIKFCEENEKEIWVQVEEGMMWNDYWPLKSIFLIKDAR